MRIPSKIGIPIISKGVAASSQVNYMETEYAAIELELGDVENWQPDRGVANYLSNRSIANEYRDAARPGYSDVSKSFAKMDISRTKYRIDTKRAMKSPRLV